MKVNFQDRTNFSARIKINKVAKSDFRDATLLSGTGTSATASGIMSSVPITDPVHHINTAAKIVDSVWALIGVGITTVGAVSMKLAANLFKHGIKSSKIKQ